MTKNVKGFAIAIVLQIFTVAALLCIILALWTVSLIFGRNERAAADAPQTELAAPDTAGGILTDSRDGKTYRTVTVGNITWMAENLNFEMDSSSCYGTNVTEEAKAANCKKYGRLYTWNAALKACPDGWRLPDTADWNNLARAAGGRPYGRDRWTGAGKRLKSKTGWYDREPGFIFRTKGGPGGGSDDLFFSALPGGERDAEGFCWVAGAGAYWWSTAHGGNELYWYHVSHSDDDLDRHNYGTPHDSWEYEYSVRCVEG